MNQPSFLHEAAEAELTAAFEWYFIRSQRAATHFLDDVRRTTQRIGQSPEQFPRIIGKARRALLNRFPYGIVFRETQSGIQILAVAHAKRRPGYWRVRMTQ